MLRHCDLRGALTALTICLSAATASADKIIFTGNVETDMPLSNTSITTIPGNARNAVGQADWMTAEGKVNGWVMKDVRLSYHADTDTMYVGVNFWGVAGDVDGDGNPGVADPRTIAVGGSDLPNLGGHKSIAVAFAPDSSTNPGTMGTPVVIAGVPFDKSKAGPGIDGFTVSSYAPVNSNNIAYNFKDNLPSNQGTLAFNPDASHPDFEFTIKNFKQLGAIDPAKGVWVSAYAGSPEGIVSGANFIRGFRVPSIATQQIPEPTTVLGWTVVTLGFAWRARRTLSRKYPETDRS